MKIIAARITPLPRPLPEGFADKMPQVFVTVEGEEEKFLFEYYPDEIQFTEDEFIGLTIQEAKGLKAQKDKNYLLS